MDPIGSLAKGVTGAVLDKIAATLQTDQTSQDAPKDPKLRDGLLAKLPADAPPSDSGVRDNAGGLRSVR